MGWYSMGAVKAENLPQRSRRLASRWGKGLHRRMRPSMVIIACRFTNMDFALLWREHMERLLSELSVDFTLQTHCTKNLKQIFPVMKLRGLVQIFGTVCLQCEIYTKFKKQPLPVNNANSWSQNHIPRQFLCDNECEFIFFPDSYMNILMRDVE